MVLTVCDTRRDVKGFTKVDFLEPWNRPGLHTDLLGQKLKHGLDQVLIKVEIIVRHLDWENQKALAFALLM